MRNLYKDELFAINGGHSLRNRYGFKHGHGHKPKYTNSFMRRTALQADEEYSCEYAAQRVIGMLMKNPGDAVVSGNVVKILRAECVIDD